MFDQKYAHLTNGELEALAMDDIDAAFEHMHRLRLAELQSMSDEELEALAMDDIDAARELYNRALYERDRLTLELVEILFEEPDEFLEEPCWPNISDNDLKLAARQILVTSTDENEFKRRLRDELCYPYEVAITSHMPTDQVGFEARAIVRALGGPMLKNGAMVMVMMHGHDGVISI